MKKTILFCLLLFPMLSSGQQFKLGLNWNLLFWHFMAPENQGQVNLPDWVYKEHERVLQNMQINGSFHYPVFKFKDEKMSLGVNLNAAFGYLLTPDLDLNGVFTFDLPQYLMFRYGNGATRNNKKGIGIGIGVGYTYEIIPFNLGTPVICADITFGRGFTFRLGTDIQKRTLWGYYSADGRKPELVYREVIIQFSTKF